MLSAWSWKHCRYLIIEMKEVAFDSNQTLERLPEFCRKYPFDRAIAVTVIDLEEAVTKCLKGLPFPLLWLNRDTPLPVENLYETPQTLGYDRMAAVVAANARFPGKDVLVIDEPTSQLDPQSTDEIFEIIQEMKRMGKTIVLVEHKMEQIAEYADQVIVLNQGKIVLEGTPQEVFSHPDCETYQINRPQSTRIALELAKEGVALSEIPIILEQAVNAITKTMGQ